MAHAFNDDKSKAVLTKRTADTRDAVVTVNSGSAAIINVPLTVPTGAKVVGITGIEIGLGNTFIVSQNSMKVIPVSWVLNNDNTVSVGVLNTHSVSFGVAVRVTYYTA